MWFSSLPSLGHIPTGKPRNHNQVPGPGHPTPSQLFTHSRKLASPEPKAQQAP